MTAAASSIFGEPHKGIHAYRFMNIAIVDVVFTLLAAWLIAQSWHIPLVPVLFACFLAGIIAHRIFHVRTTVDRWLFG